MLKTINQKKFQSMLKKPVKSLSKLQTEKTKNIVSTKKELNKSKIF